ncbi:MAG TPA: hypothetical protein VKQ70_09955 [Caulobacteraceae bacterium]|nr:hypothetical protein [Caulobacteraceae bacterium]
MEAQLGKRLGLMRADEEPIESWPILDSLTIFEGAMAYCAVHPHHPFCPVPHRHAPDEERRDHALFYGYSSRIGESKGPGAYVARDVLHELCRRVASGVVTPVRRADLDNGEPDPLHTEIPLSAVLAIARERGDAAEPVKTLAVEGLAPDWSTVPLANKGSWATNPLVVEEAESRARALHKDAEGAVVKETELCRQLEHMARERGVPWTALNAAALRRKLRATKGRPKET